MTGPRPIHDDDEERIAALMSGELEGLAARSGITPGSDFADRVMTAVRHEPLPQPTRAFGTALAAHRFGVVLAAVGDAWRVALGGSTTMAVRAQALGLAIVVTSGSLALAGGAAVGAADLLNAIQPNHPSPTVPQPSQRSPSPSPSPSPSAATNPPAEPSATPDSSAIPEGTDNAGATERFPSDTSMAATTDDHGGVAGGSGDSKPPRPRPVSVVDPAAIIEVATDDR